jgi:hypothetical protein
MKTNIASCLLVLSLVSATRALFVPAVYAASIAEDSFDSYPVGTGNSLVGQNGGSGWAGPWTIGLGNTADPVDTTGAPLSFTPSGGSAIDGGARAVELAGTANQIVVTRQFSAPLPDTFYVAYMFRVTAGSWTDTDTCSLHLGANATSTSTPNFGLRGPDLFMVRTGTGTPVAGASIVIAGATAIGTNSYLVARFSKLDGSGNPTATYDRVELWVNPAMDDNMITPTGDARLQLPAGTGLTTAGYLLVRAAALEAADRVQIDHVIVGADWDSVLNSSAAPLITGLAPANGTTFWPASNGISFQVNSALPVNRADIGLELNGSNVSGGLVITGDPSDWTVTYSGLATNLVYNGRVTVSNTVSTTSIPLRFDTFTDSAGVVVEVEDYNYDLTGECEHGIGALLGGTAGGFQTNPPASGYDLTSGARVGGPQGNQGYVDAPGYPERDFHDSVSVALNPSSSLYRNCDFVGTRAAREPRRKKYLDRNLPEYEVFQMVTGDWMNYTRIFAPANYRVYLRAAGSVAGQVQLGKVNGDPSTESQTVAPVGTFLLPNTGGTNSYLYVPLTDALGLNEVTVTLAGTDTIRLTSLSTDTNSGLNFLLLVPAGASLAPPVAAITSPTNGAEYPAGATIPVTVTASDSDGSVINILVTVVGFNTTNVLGVFSTSPVNLSWTNVADGNYTLHAVATDNSGLRTSAVPVPVKVGHPPLPSLLVVGALPMNAGDSAVFNRLAFLGLPVVVQLASTTTSADGDGKQLIAISSSVLSGDVGTKFTASSTPVIQWEQALVDEFLISSAGSLLGGQREIVITDAGAAHPLGAGLPAGTNLVRTTAVEFHFATEVNLAPGAVVIARAANDTNTSPAIVGVDTGGTLNNGSPAPARRVHMFWGDSGLSNVNAAGLSLFDAAVNWASGRAVAGPALRIARSGNNLIISWPAAATGAILQENTDVANTAGWVNTSRTIDNDGTTKSVTITVPMGNLFLRLIKQ